MFIPTTKGRKLDYSPVELELEEGGFLMSPRVDVNVVDQHGNKKTLVSFVEGQYGIRMVRGRFADEDARRFGIDTVSGKIVFNE